MSDIKIAFGLTKNNSQKKYSYNDNSDISLDFTIATPKKLNKIFKKRQKASEIMGLSSYNEDKKKTEDLYNNGSQKNKELILELLEANNGGEPRFSLKQVNTAFSVLNQYQDKLDKIPKRKELLLTLIESNKDDKTIKAAMSLFGARPALDNSTCAVLMDIIPRNGYEQDIGSVLSELEKMPKDDESLKKIIGLFNNAGLSDYDIIPILKAINSSPEEKEAFKELTVNNNDGSYKYHADTITDTAYYLRKDNKSFSKSLADAQEANLYENKIKNDFGIKSEFHSNNDTAKFTYLALKDMKKAGVDKFPKGGINVVSQVFELKNYLGCYEDETEEIKFGNLIESYYDDSTSFFKAPDADLKNDSTQILNSVYHEMGHFLHHQNNPKVFLEQKEQIDAKDFDKEYMELREQIEAEVCDYAAFRPLEFVAEITEGIMAGKEFDEKLMNLYYKYGGVKLSTNDQEKP